MSPGGCLPRGCLPVGCLRGGCGPGCRRLTVGASGRRDLSFLFDPASIAVVGASADESKWGGDLAARLLRAECRRPVYLVNRRGGEMHGQVAYRSLSELPEAPEMVILAMPAAALEATLDEALALGSKAFVAIFAGLGETDDEGRERERAAVARLRAAGAAMIGPNCMGLADHSTGLQAVAYPRRACGPRRLRLAERRDGRGVRHALERVRMRLLALRHARQPGRRRHRRDPLGDGRARADARRGGVRGRAARGARAGAGGGGRRGRRQARRAARARPHRGERAGGPLAHRLAGSRRRGRRRRLPRRRRRACGHAARALRAHGRLPRRLSPARAARGRRDRRGRRRRHRRRRRPRRRARGAGLLRRARRSRPGGAPGQRRQQPARLRHGHDRPRRLRAHRAGRRWLRRGRRHPRRGTARVLGRPLPAVRDAGGARSRLGAAGGRGRPPRRDAVHRLHGLPRLASGEGPVRGGCAGVP